MLTTVIMLFLTFAAFIAIIDIKSEKLSKSIPSLNAMSAEDLLEMIVGVPLSDILRAGDSIEIIVSTNSHHIARREYVASDWHSIIKLEPVKAIKIV